MVSMTDDEKVSLAFHTGRLMGLSLKDYNTIAIACQRNLLCTATASALAASFTNYTGGSARIIVLDSNLEKKILDSLEKQKPQALVILVGSESKPEECQKILKELLETLASKSVKIDIIISLKAYLTGCFSRSARETPILSYTEFLKYLRLWGLLTYTVDFRKGVFILGKIASINEDTVEVEKLAEYPLLVEHFELLKKHLEGIQ